MSKEITFGERFGYGLGDLASNLFWMQFVYYLNYFYTDVFGLAPAALFTMILAVRFWDSVNDPIVGMIADRTNSRWGKFRPYLLWGALPLAVVGSLTFTTPDLSPSGKLIYAYATYGMLMLIYTVVNIPYSSLMGVVSSDPSERTRFSQIRFIMAFAGGLIVQAATLPMAEHFGAQEQGPVSAELRGQEIVITEQGSGASSLIVSARSPDYQEPGFVQRLGIRFGVIDEAELGMVRKRKTIHVNTAEYFNEAGLKENPVDLGKFESISYLPTGFGSLVIPLSDVFDESEVPGGRYTVFVLNKQRGFRATMTIFGVVAALLFVVTFATTRERVQPSAKQKTSPLRDLRDLVTNRPWLILFALGMITLFHVCLRNGSIIYWCKYNLGNEKIGPLFMLTGTLASLISIFMVRRLEKLFGKKWSYALCMLSTLVLSMVFYLIPENQIGLLMTVHILISLSFGPTSALVWAMYTDAADFGEWKNGRRATGLVMSACTMAQKFGYTLGGALAMAILFLVGYQADAVQSPETLAGIKGMVSWIAALPCALGVFLILLYPLNELQLKGIENDLKTRRSASEQELL